MAVTAGHFRDLIRRRFVTTAYADPIDLTGKTVIVCATHPGLRGGLYYQECQPSEASKDAEAEEVAARLWAQTGAWAGA